MSRKIWTILLCAAVGLALASSVHAATYYMPDNFASLQAAFAGMNSGDTLIVRDGTYTGDANRISSANYPPVGSSGSYTVVKAEHDGAAVFDGQNARSMFDFDTASDTNKYWRFEGMLWCRSNGTTVQITHSNYVKFLRCGAYDAGDGNNVNFSIGNSCSYVLLENCYAYGSGRYKFLAYIADHVIFRNCVGRLDRVNAFSDHPEPIAIFAIYYGQNCIAQNCIAIDSDQTSAYTNYDGTWGAFYTISNGAYPCDNNKWLNCMALNVKLGGIFTDTSVTNTTYQDCVVWNSYWSASTTSPRNYIRGNNTVVNKCTFGASDIASGSYFHVYGDSSNSESIKNTILYNLHNGYAVGNINTKDYNCYYLNTNNDSSNSPGSHSKTAVNPLYNASNNPSGALKYITRVEAGSNLSGQGEGGVDIGAKVTTRLGTSGALYGETGYNTDTGNLLWPFPSEDLIRSKMRAYNAGGVSGSRGFCADGKTLTKYIWEYLGNTMPQDISGGSSDTVAPAAVTTLTVTGTTSNSAALRWTAPGDDGSTGTAASYDVRYNTQSITDSNWGTSTQISAEPSPQAAGTVQTMTVSGLNASTTYYFAMKASDEVPNTSALSNVASAGTGAGTGGSTDTTAPSAVTTLTVTSSTGNSAVLRWTSPGDDGSIGTATSYDVRYNTQSITDSNWGASTQTSTEPAPQAAGTVQALTVSGLNASTTYYFAMKANDEVPNTSALSNVASVTTGTSVVSDTTAPAAITTLTVTSTTNNSAALRWAAPGDDANSGTATSYDIRFSTATITAATWAAATQVSTEPAPQAAGSVQAMTISGLSASTTYYFAIKATDEAGNIAGLSNVAGAKVIADTTAPAAVTTLAVTGTTANSAALRWSAPGDDGSSGTATSYDIRYSTAIITTANWAGATQVSGEPVPQSSGIMQTMTINGLSALTTYYFAIKAADEAGNVSNLSNIVTGGTSGANYYIAPDGDDTAGDGSEGHPWATLSRAFASMAGGDTLIIKDGLYAGEANAITTSHFPPAGKSSGWTTVKAEHDGMAMFDGEHARSMFNFDAASVSAKYWRFEGLMWRYSNADTVRLTHASYVKFFGCGAYDAGDGNFANFLIGNSCEFILLEECFAYGSGRFMFAAGADSSAFTTSHIIFRKCVGRLDSVTAPAETTAVFALYNVDDSEAQNCIAIDSDQAQAYSSAGGSGSFYVGAKGDSSNRINFWNCIALNNDIGGLVTQADNSNSAKDVVFNNCVAWDCNATNGGTVNLIQGLNTKLVNCTLGESIVTGSNYHVSSLDSAGVSNNSSIRNSIFYHMTGGAALYDVESEDYNCLFSNTNNYLVTTKGTHTLLATNPVYNASANLTGALKYLCRIESGSNLKAKGESGVDIGASCLKMIGALGTLWGESGYNSVQTQAMWPFPNEESTRAQMRAYTRLGVLGERGFCAPGQTLTTYVWEYLGNPIPLLVPPSDLEADIAQGESIKLTWQDNSAIEDGFIIERKEAGGQVYQELAIVPQNTTNFEDVLVAPGIEYSYRSKSFDGAEESAYCSEVLAASLKATSPTSSGGGGGAGGGGGGGCFIATAAFGSPMAEQVRILSMFRDEYLLKNLTGRSMVGMYSKLSPPAADFIRNKPAARSLVRSALMPIIFVAEICRSSE